MLYQRYFLRMNQSNMTHVLGLLAGLALALALLLIVKLSYTGKQPLFNMLQRPENLSLAVTLLTCIVVYAGNKSRPRDPARVLRGKLRQRHPRLCFGFCFLLPSDRSSSVPLVIFTFPGIVSAYRLERTSISILELASLLTRLRQCSAQHCLYIYLLPERACSVKMRVIGNKITSFSQPTQLQYLQCLDTRSCQVTNMRPPTSRKRLKTLILLSFVKRTITIFLCFNKNLIPWLCDSCSK